MAALSMNVTSWYQEPIHSYQLHVIMEMQSFVGSIILIFTGLVTYNGFLKKEYFEKHLFEVDKVLIDKEYSRLITSGFLHLNILQCIFYKTSFFIITFICFSIVVFLFFLYFIYIIYITIFLYLFKM